MTIPTDLPLAKEVFLNHLGVPLIYVTCEPGDEEKLKNSLPFWLTSLGEVHTTHRAVYIELCNKDTAASKK